MKKYEITDIAHPDNPNLHRIRAVTDLTENVLAGMLGGYVESWDNLDQDGRAWIAADAIACENAVEILRQNDVYLITTECDLNDELINSGLERFVGDRFTRASFGKPRFDVRLPLMDQF